MSRLMSFLEKWTRRGWEKVWDVCSRRIRQRKLLLLLNTLASIGILVFMASLFHKHPEVPVSATEGRGFPNSRNTPSMKAVTADLGQNDTTFTASSKKSSDADQSPSIDEPFTEEELVAKIEVSHPNFPTYRMVEKSSNEQNKSCTTNCMPPLVDIKFNNIYWQTLQTANGSYYLYSAFYDNRTLVDNKPIVRILGMIDRVGLPAGGIYCQMWFGYDSGGVPLVSPVEEYNNIWHCGPWKECEPGKLHPYLLGCRIPKDSIHYNQVPRAVSLVNGPIDSPTNMLRVVHNTNDPGHEAKQNFAVCVKSLSYYHLDYSVRLVEWIELMKILGADKIFVYELALHPRATEVLRYYEQRGFVELITITLAGKQPNIPGFMHHYLKGKLQDMIKHEIISYNDCLYRNMYRYKYVVPLDTDDVIMPLVESSWKEMLDKRLSQTLAAANISEEASSTINFRSIAFYGRSSEHWYNDIPKYMHMLQHVNRTLYVSPAPQSIKTFQKTERVSSVTHHFPHTCAGGRCASVEVDLALAISAHYRDDCLDHYFSKDDCYKMKNQTFKEPGIWRFKDELIQSTTKAMGDLGFFKP